MCGIVLVKKGSTVKDCGGMESVVQTGEICKSSVFGETLIFSGAEDGKYSRYYNKVEVKGGLIISTTNLFLFFNEGTLFVSRGQEAETIKSSLDLSPNTNFETVQKMLDSG